MESDKIKELEETIKKLKQENAFLDSIIDNIPNMIFLKDAKDLKFVRVNKAFEDILGYSKNDFLGKNDYDFFPKDEADFFTGKDREVLKSKEILDIKEEPVQTKSKDIRILHTKKSALCDKKNNPVYLLGIAEDITHIKSAEDQLKKTQDQLKLTLDAAKIGSWHWDIENNVFEWDDIMYELFQVKDKNFKITHESWLSLIDPKERQKIDSIVMNSVANATDFSFDVTVPNSENTKHITLRGVVEEKVNGQATHLRGICLDITEEKNRQALEIKSELISMVSHELRTPLHTIKDGVGLILEELVGEINSKQREVLETCEVSIDRLKRLINNVLDFQKMDAGITSLFLEEKNINNIIEETLSFEQRNIHNKNLACQVDFDVNMPKALLDSDKITQVVLNLLHNAIKFTSDGFISIRTQNKGNVIQVAFEDTGIGLQDEDLSNIFKEFGQSNLAKKLSPEGTGLGLAISKKIIESHQGRIWAEPRKPKGSVFAFEIPINHGVAA